MHNMLIPNVPKKKKGVKNRINLCDIRKNEKKIVFH